MTGLIITGGSIDCAFAGAFLKDKTFDMVIAVDGGLAAVKQLDIRPDAIVGDFDTVKGELLEEYGQIEGITFNAIVNLFPTICIIISMIPLFWYKLDKKMMDKIRVELDERNAKNA